MPRKPKFYIVESDHGTTHHYTASNLEQAKSYIKSKLRVSKQFKFSLEFYTVVISIICVYSILIFYWT